MHMLFFNKIGRKYTETFVKLYPQGEVENRIECGKLLKRNENEFFSFDKKSVCYTKTYINTALDVIIHTS